MAGTYANDQGYGLGAQAIALAARYIGVPYVWGGTSPKGFDCSGLVQFVYKNLGIKLPRTSEEQAKIGITVAYKDAQPGDLLIYTYSTTADHVGLYAGNGQQIDAPRPGRTVERAAVDTKHLVKVIRPFTGGSTSTSGGTAAGGTTNQALSLNPLDAVGDGLDAFGKTLATTAIKSVFVVGGVGLVVVGLWRGVGGRVSPMST
jgi:hypothetical protein